MRVFTLLYFTILFNIRKEVPSAAFAAGLVLALSGETIRLFAQSVIKKNRTLAVTGLYSVTRHPLYFGSLLMLTGFACFHITKSFYPGVAAFWFFTVVFFLPLYWKKIRDEEKFLGAQFPQFKDYKNSVPVFFPAAPFMHKLKELRLEKKGILGNNEHKMLCGLTVMLIIIGLGFFYY